MNTPRFSLLSALTLALAGSTLAWADTAELHTEKVIAIDSGNGSLIELDVSDLQDGEAMEAIGEDGTRVDVIKSADGLELYVDGQLLDEFGRAMELASDKDLHMIRTACDDEGETEQCAHVTALVKEHLTLTDGEDISKIIKIDCRSEDECMDLAWIDELAQGSDIHVEHDVKVIRIEKHSSEESL